MLARKRELLAHGLFWVPLLPWRLAARDSLLVLNHHRIGNPDDDPFDPDVFSATGDALDDQIRWLRRHASLVTLEEALCFVEGTARDKTPRCRVLITFDDGYLDNYDLAFPILRSHGVQGVFFLATSIVGSRHIPWWDRIAYAMRTARARRFTLRYPGELAVNLDEDGLGRSLRAVLDLFKRPDNADPARFIQELTESAKGDAPAGTQRRFLNWDEARAMLAGGMAIGSHTDSHTVLSQLTPEQQRLDLARSRAILRERLGIAADTLAYPVGDRTAFTGVTQELARECGYRAAFSFYGGTNLPGRTNPYSVERVDAGDQSRTRFRVQLAICTFTGRHWP